MYTGVGDDSDDNYEDCDWGGDDFDGNDGGEDDYDDCDQGADDKMVQGQTGSLNRPWQMIFVFLFNFVSNQL